MPPDPHLVNENPFPGTIDLFFNRPSTYLCSVLYTLGKARGGYFRVSCTWDGWGGDEGEGHYYYYLMKRAKNRNHHTQWSIYNVNVNNYYYSTVNRRTLTTRKNCYRTQYYIDFQRPYLI